MTVIHTKSYWWKYLAETNIAGGDAGIAYATTVPAADTNLVKCSHPFNEEQTMPMAEYIQEALEAAGQDISTKQTFTKGVKIIPGKLVQYMHDGIWLDWALGIAPAGNGGGGLPKTFALHYSVNDGTTEYTAYGCYITEYKLSAAKGDYIKEEITFPAYDVQAEVVAETDQAFLATAIKNFEDVGTTTITIDGTVITDLQNVSVTVTNTFTEGPTPGSFFHKLPYLLKRDVEIEMEFYTYASDPLLDMLIETAALSTIVFTSLGAVNFEATNMKPKPESVNINTVPEKGMKAYKVVFEIGGASAFTTP